MRDFSRYGRRKKEDWRWFPWLPWWPPETRPPFEISTKPEQVAPFFFVEHHPYAISLLLKIGDGFKAEFFQKMGLSASSRDWETLVLGFIDRWEEENSGEDLFCFDSDRDVFCVYSQYIDDMSLFSRELRQACDDEEKMRYYLRRGEKRKGKPAGENREEIWL